MRYILSGAAIQQLGYGIGGNFWTSMYYTICLMIVWWSLMQEIHNPSHTWRIK